MFVKMKEFYDEMYIEEVIEKISQKKCLCCDALLDHDLKKKNWQIPLCTEHRKAYLHLKFIEGTFLK